MYAQPLSPDCDTPFFWLAAALEFCCMKPTIWTVSAGCVINAHSPPASAGCVINADSPPASAGCVINVHSPLAVLRSSLLWYWLSGSWQGPEVCWSGQCWAFMALQLAVSWCCPKEIPEALVYLHSATAGKKSVNTINLTSLSHWLACISYLFWTGRHGTENVLTIRDETLGNPLLKLEAFYPICVEGCQRLGMPNI